MEGGLRLSIKTVCVSFYIPYGVCWNDEFSINMGEFSAVIRTERRFVTGGSIAYPENSQIARERKGKIMNVIFLDE